MLSQLKKQLPSSILMLLILVFGAIYLFNGTMSKYPAYVHAWTQSDRIAIAQNFQENGFDFFHPATYNLLTKDGVTQVDFPIHDYFVAVVSSITSQSVVVIFHWYNLIYSLIGLFFLFHFFLLFTKSMMRSIMGTTFIFTLPFFVYYQNGFLPSTASFANLFIGLFFVFNSYKSKNGYTLGVIFITLAALARAPFFIFLFALLLNEIVQEIRLKRFKFSRVSKLLMGIAIFIGYYFYNQHLGKTFGSMFLNETLHFTSVSNFVEVVFGAADRWSNQLMSPYHAILLIPLIVACIFQYKNLKTINHQKKKLLSFLLISFIGVLFFFIAFGRQFTDHDYYYIDSFLPLFSLWIIFMLSIVTISKKWYTFIGGSCFIFFFYFFGYSKDIQSLRYTPPFDDRVEYAFNVYQSSADDLKTWGVNKKDTLYVIDANSTNIPFTIWGNKGYSNLKTRANILGPELDSNFTYATMVDSFFFNNVYKDYPHIINQLERVEGNGKLSLYRKSAKNNPSLFFTQLHYEKHTNFEQQGDLPKSATAWLPIEQSDSLHGKSLKIEAKNVYALTIRDTIRNKFEIEPLRIQLVGDYFQNDSSRMQVIFRVGSYYGVHYTISELKTIDEWQKHQFSFVVDPLKFKDGDLWEIFVWNPDQTELIVDNLNLIIFQ
ncbi:MAG: hypothetical protein ACJASF_001925 [Vicingaceae bacterium]|jgi:hypothetical protein